MGDITLLLDAVHRGEPNAASDLLGQVYADLRQLARAKMARERPEHTLQPTALVHEAWLRLAAAGGQDQHFESRAHFFAAAAEAMRRILVESARQKCRIKRGGGVEHCDINELEVSLPAESASVLEIHEVLDQFAREEPQKAELVKLKYFVGLTLTEAGELLGLPERTAKRHWAYARAWLYHAIRKQRSAGEPS